MSGALANAPEASATPPSAPGPATAEAPRLRIPSLGRRLAIAGLRFTFVILAIVAVPAYLLGIVGGLKFSTPIAVGGIAVLGLLFGAVGAARYVGRPTRLFGPLTVVASFVSIAYLLYLIPIASFGFQPDVHTGIAIDFGRFLEYCLIAPVFGIAAGLVTTVEDFARPRERIEYEYAV